MKALHRIAAGIDSLNHLIGSVIRWLALLMVLIGAYNALARWLTRYFDVSLASNAYLDLQWYLFSLIFLMGAAYGLQHDVHVRVDVLYSRLGERGQAWIDLFGSVLFLLPFCVVMLWVSWPAVASSWAIREDSPDPGGLVRYPIKTVILICFFLLFLQGVSQIIKKVTVLRGEKLPDELRRRSSGEVQVAAVGEDAKDEGD